MTRSQKLALTTVAAYTTIMAVGMYTLKHVVHSDYQNVDMANTIFFFEVAMSILAAAAYLRHFKGFALRKQTTKPRKIFLFVFGAMILGLTVIAYLFAVTGKFSTAALPQLLTVFAATALVGFSEELVYRGIALPVFLENGSRFKAILISSALFSSLHAVNSLGGLPVTAMLIQLVITFLVGITLACIATEIGVLTPLMIFHALWDFLFVAGDYVGADTGTISSAQVAFEIVFGLILLLIIKKDESANAESK